MGKDAPTHTFPELRGERNIDGDTVAGVDRRYGVPVPIGTLAYMSNIDQCIVIGGNEEIAIVLDKNGTQWAETWGCLWVQPSGPAWVGNAAVSQQAPDDSQRFFDLAKRLAALEREIDHVLDEGFDLAERGIRDVAAEARDIATHNVRQAIDALIEGGKISLHLAIDIQREEGEGVAS